MNVNNLEKYLEEIAESNPLIEFNRSVNNFAELNDALYVKEDQSLSKYLLEQLSYVPHPHLCEILIYDLNSNGYFNKTFDELLLHYNINKTLLDNAINILQNLEPYGIACFNLKETLIIQIKHSNYPDKDNAILMLEYLEDIAKNNIGYISKQTKLPSDKIVAIIDFIKILNPKPAANFSTDSKALIPDIIISTENEITIKVTNIIERITFIDDYKNNKELKQFNILNNQIKNQINLRNKTIAQVVNSIVEFQYEYFIFNKPLKPMKLKDIAVLINLNQSTISRAIQNKLMDFNGKYILLKSLFTTNINNKSSAEIKNKIKNLIKSETQPLSDQTIANILGKDGIKVSRRTVNKYRKQLNINPSFYRKAK